MSISSLDYYLTAVNIAGFAISAINSRSGRKNGRISSWVAISALLGGTPGILAAILVFDRKARKENMMERVFVSCLFVIQIILLFMLKGLHREDISLDFMEFFKNRRPFAIYLAAINIAAFASFGIDKFNAAAGRFRIRISFLLGLSFAGGAAGGLLAMYLFRHKTRKNYFTVGLPLMIVMQITVIFYLMNLKFG